MIKIAVRPKTTRAELGAVVCRALSKELGDDPALIGGSAANIYSGGKYRSDDLDIVTWRDNAAIAPVMERLGFIKKGMYWEHAATELLIQFINPPVTIGEKYVRTFARRRTKAGDLSIISALDSACDRLQAFIAYGDTRSLKISAAIVIKNRVSLAAIAKWLSKEPYSVKKLTVMVELKNEINLQRKKRKKRRHPKARRHRKSNY